MNDDDVIELSGNDAVLKIGLSEEHARSLIKDGKKSLRSDSRGHAINFTFQASKIKRIVNSLIDQIK